VAQLRDFKGIEGADFFDEDRGFQTLLADLLSPDSRDDIFNSLHSCAQLVSSRWDELAREASRPENLPRIRKFDRTGNPIEQIDFGPLTRQLRREVAEFGVLTAFRNEVHKFAVVYLLAHNGEASVNCGLSCTDGLIRAIEGRGSSFLRETYLPALRSVETPLAGAQFVTERAGGSDVGAIECVASLKTDGVWQISGEKWFCSNPDEYFLVAARPDGAAAGTSGLAIFLVPRVLPDGELNSISFKGLKDKLGTRSLPTAEMEFHNATGYLIGDAPDGFRTLMNFVINVSRIHNAANACGFMHRAFLEARNYARQREAFGQTLISFPMIQETLLTLLERTWRYRLLTFRLARMIDDRGLIPDDPRVAMWQRFLINLAKYRSAARLTDSVREAILVFGGNGIVEDFTVLPRLLRDSMIIETWEGPHNTLCLQMVRDCARSGLLARWSAEVSACLEQWPENFLSLTRERIAQSFERAKAVINRESLNDSQWASANARRVVDLMGDLLELAWMAEMAKRHSERDSTAAILLSLAGYYLLPGHDKFEHPVFSVLREHGGALINEEPVLSDVNRI
jgi:alkylation response protein AidB-like acyl-CoA dehydrogenase